MLYCSVTDRLLKLQNRVEESGRPQRRVNRCRRTYLTARLSRLYLARSLDLHALHGLLRESGESAAALISPLAAI